MANSIPIIRRFFIIVFALLLHEPPFNRIPSTTVMGQFLTFA